MASYRPQIARITPANHKPVISEKARQRPVRVIPADDRAEMEASHLTGSGSAFSSNMTRPDKNPMEGFGGQEGFRSTASFGEAPTTDPDSFDTDTDTDAGSFGAAFGGFADSSSPAEPL